MDHQQWASRILGTDWSYEMSDDYSAYNRGYNRVNKMIEDLKNEHWSSDDVQSIKDHINHLLNSTFKGIYSEKGKETLLDRVSWLSQFQKKEDIK